MLCCCFFLLALWAQGQHCFYCSNYIAVLKIVPLNSNETIKNLEISLLDSLGQKVSHVYYLRETIPLTIKQNNPDQKTDSFWFAADHYTLAIELGLEGHLPGHQLKIVAKNGDKNAPWYKTKIVPLTRADFYPLCRDYSNWQKVSNPTFVNWFSPKTVVLTPY